MEPEPAGPARRLLLVGGGHAHVEVLRRYGLERPAGVGLTLVSPSRTHVYTGMITGYLAGEYALAELTFPLDTLTGWAGGEFLADRVVALDPGGRTASLAGGPRLTYDVISFDIGSEATALDVPGVADQAVVVKPLASVLGLPAALDRAAGARGADPPRLVVVGGGASGVELALVADARLRRSARGASVTLLERSHRLLAEFPPETAQLASRVLADRGIAVRLGSRVVSAEQGAARDAQGLSFPFDVLIWATGPSAPPLFAEAGLETDGLGYLAVQRSLRTRRWPEIFGAGDCIALAGHPGLPKVGVYAVREGPVLWRALRAHLLGEEEPSYRPQRVYLYALNTGDGRALLGRGRFRSHSRWGRRLKDWIDRRFMRRYLDLVT